MQTHDKIYSITHTQAISNGKCKLLPGKRIALKLNQLQLGLRILDGSNIFSDEDNQWRIMKFEDFKIMLKQTIPSKTDY
jgi:hypothetical protein